MFRTGGQTVDRTTIQRAQRGERAALESLLRQLQDPLYRLLFGLLGREELARDAVQETALRMIASLAQFSGQSQFRTWVFGIAINVAREMKRKERPAERFWKEQISSDPSIEAERGEMAQAVRSLLAELPQRQQEALVLRFFEDLTVEETAAAMKCAGGTVKATVHQALRALRERLIKVR